MATQLATLLAVTLDAEVVMREVDEDRCDRARSLLAQQRDALSERLPAQRIAALEAAVTVGTGHDGFADAQLGDDGFDIQLRIFAHGGRGDFDRFLIARREGAQGVLNAIAQLTQNGVGNVDWVLCDEVHADAFGADQAHDLLDFLQQYFRRVVEQ